MKKISFLADVAILKWKEVTTEEKPRIDDDLPFRICMGSGMEFSYLLLQAAKKDGSLIDVGDSALRVVSFGKIILDYATVYRIYFSDEKSWMQIITNGSGKIDTDEIKFFQAQDVDPIGKLLSDGYSQPKAWVMWTQEEVIGKKRKPVKVDCFFNGYEVLDLSYFLDNQEEDTIVYNRVEEGGETIEPDKYVETIYMDPFGEKTMQRTCYSMLYGRYIPEVSEGEQPKDNHRIEWALPVAYDDGEGRDVDISVGINLDPIDITVDGLEIEI